MTNKTMRILIVDENSGRLLQIEKLMNEFGYYRVAPIQSFEELVSLTHDSFGAFELLIINKELIGKAKADLNTFRLARPLIRHILLYENQSPTLGSLFYYPSQHGFLPAILEGDELEAFMSDIDSPSCWAC